MSIFNKLFASQGFSEYGYGDSAFSESGGIAGDAMRLAPLAIGVAVGYNRVSSNSSIQNMAMNPGGVSGDAIAKNSARVGDNVRRMKDLMDAQRKKQATDFMESVMREGNLENTIREAGEQRKATFSALLSQLDDTNDLTNLRATLMQAMDSTDTLTNEQIERVRSSIRTIVEAGGDDASRRFSQSVDKFGSIASQIVSPTGTIKGIAPTINPIELGSMSSRAQAYAGRLRSALGGADITFHSLTEHAGERGTSIYAKARTRAGTLTVPLELAKLPVGQSGNLPVDIFRMGNLNTTYTAKQMYIDAPSFQTALTSGKPLNAITASTLAQSKPTSTFMDFTEAFMREVESMSSIRKGSLSSADVRYLHKLGTSYGTLLDRPARPSARSIDPSMTKHLQRGALFESSYAQILNMERIPHKDRDRLVAMAVTDQSGMFSGVSGGKAEIARMEEIGQLQRSTGQIAFTGMGPSGAVQGNAPLNALRQVGRLDPVLQPLTARARQMVGRPERFVNSNHGGDMSRVESTLGKSKSIRMYGQNLGFTAGIGGVNSAVLMDLGAGARLGLGEGMAYWGMQPTVQSHMVKTVMDPESVGRESYALLEDLKARRRAGEGPLTIRGKANLAAFFEKYGSGKHGGAVLGMLDEKVITIPKFSDLSALSIDLKESSISSTGRGTFHFDIMKYRGPESLADKFQVDKVFSQGAKSTTIPLDQRGLSELVRRMSEGEFGQKNLGKILEELGLNSSQLMVNQGDMMKKSVYYLQNQVFTSLGMQETVNMEKVYAGANQAINKSDYMREYDKLGHLGKQRAQSLAVAEFAASSLAEGTKAGITAQKHGLTFAGLMSMQRQGMYGLQTGDVEAAMRKGFGGKVDDTVAAEIIESARKEIALGAYTFAPGTPSSSMRSTMSSMEQRSYQFLHHRLTSTLGMSNDAAADFMTAFMSRKVGVGEELTALKSLSRSVESMGGLRSVLDKDFRSGLTSIRVSDFLEGMGGNEDTARKFLSQHKQGFLLDFGTADTKLQGVAKYFSDQRQIYIPGGDLVDSLKGTKIVRAGQDINIQNEFIRRTTDFAQNLERIQTGAFGTASTELAEAQRRAGATYKEAVGDIFGKTWKSLMSGKIEGSSFIQGAGIKLGTNFTLGFDQANVKRMTQLFAARSGEAVFADSQAFLDAMRGYMGAAKKEMIAGGMGTKDASRRAAGETAKIFESFFLGMEMPAKSGKAAERFEGIGALLSRHPQVGPGHIAPSSIFRSDFGAMDDIFDRFAKTAQGESIVRGMSKQYGRDIKSFLDVAKFKAQGGDVSKLFRSMSEGIDSYVGEGKGRIHFPEMNATVHYTNGGKFSVNLSKAAQMIGDFDQDYYQLQVFSKRRHEVFKREALAKSFAEDAAYAAKTQQFFHESKEGLKKIAALSGGELSGSAFAYNEQMKEFYAKKIGPLNIALDQVRFGMTHAIKSKEDRELAMRGLAIFEAMQELQIKGKKLPIAAEFANLLTAAVNRGVQSGGEDLAMFRNVLKESVFRDSAMFKGGLSIDKIEIPGFEGNVSRHMRRAIEQAEMSNIDDVIGFIGRGMAAAQDLGLDKLATASRTSGTASLTGHRQREIWKSSFWDAKTAQGAMMKGETTGASYYAGLMGDVSDKMSKVGGIFSKRGLGPVALGAMGTLALGMMTGDSGFRSKPMIMPGEISDHRVEAAISQGMLTQRDHSATPPPEVPDRMNVGNRPINMQESYFTKSNPYQIQATARSYEGLDQITSWVNRLGGSSAVRINDTRMPITPNYIDKIMGD